MHLNQGKKMAEQKFLIIVEGEKAEVEVIKSLENAGLFPIGNQVIAYCGEIHQLFRLYEKLSHDDGLDTIGLLISKNVIAKNSKRDDFSEIYLFFDYDLQALTFKDDQNIKQIDEATGNKQIQEMLDFFNDETGNGKLFISYPMVESVKKCLCYKHLDDFIGCKISKNYESLVGFKKYAREHAYDKNCGFSRIDEAQWKEIVGFTCRKSNALTTQMKDFPSNVIEQESIFEAQQGEDIYLLSAFPLMLLHYFGAERLIEKLQ